MKEPTPLGEYELTIKELSDRIVKAQRPIRVLDALKWDSKIEGQFLQHKGKKLPLITSDYYQKNNPLSYDPNKKIEEFREIDRAIRKQLGQYSSVGSIMERMCYEYIRVIEMLKARGTPRFTEISHELYGSAEDAFHAGAPTLKDLGALVTSTLENIKDQVNTADD
jgi:hypothetical protein